ncbi:TetR family transcriptional regulator [Rhizobium sp. TRM96647]|uniref:TetR family transcriptional regulator n=1 Tax=unclassified Rhizobium TaxID=2613769 RepID=UPI0021E97113|nr:MULTISPECIES: TetR family transcriptional regulator [unclassified Rhizobium]MCV3736690.1 TetR family transcriptional regulator [Rhizobium sp. TRM96647]MCV3756910.1 TetR family transcriptional regulator [Rhizobium sp. TRM96650]
MRRTKAHAEATRQQILHAAERVFFEKGVSNASMEEVALAAGVTRGAIYWHFANKSDLFMELYKSVPLPQEDMIARELEVEGVDVFAVIERMAAEWLEVLAKDEQRQRILSILLRCDYGGELAPVLAQQQQVFDEHVRILEKAFARAAETGKLDRCWTPRALASSFCWMMKGLCVEWLLFGRRFDLAAEGRDGLSRFIRGLRAA